jgi:hypothetical protein
MNESICAFLHDHENPSEFDRALKLLLDLVAAVDRRDISFGDKRRLWGLNIYRLRRSIRLRHRSRTGQYGVQLLHGFYFSKTTTRTIRTGKLEAYIFFLLESTLSPGPLPARRAYSSVPEANFPSISSASYKQMAVKNITIPIIIMTSAVSARSAVN